jgi:hypothetical protein
MHLNLNKAYAAAVLVSAALAGLAIAGQVTWWLVPAPIEAVVAFTVYCMFLILARASREGGRVAVRLFGKIRFYINFDR